MANITGSLTINNTTLIEVDGDPAVVAGTPAAIGSIAFYNTGSIGSCYLKTGLADTDWTRVTNQAIQFTSSRIPVADSNGFLTDDSNLTFDLVSKILTLGSAIRLGTTSDTTNGNIRFNGVGLEFYRNGWRDLSFPKYKMDDLDFATLGSGANPHDAVGVVLNGGTATINTAATTGLNAIGMVTLATGTTNNSTGVASLSLWNSVNKISLGQSPVTIEWRCRVPTLSAANPRYEIRLGLQNADTTGDPTAGVYFSYTSSVNSGQWQGISRSASTSSTVNSSIAVAANTWYRLRAEINATRTNIDFYVDSGSGYVLIGSSTTNIPTTAEVLRPVAKINKGSNSATSRTLDLDWVWWALER